MDNSMCENCENYDYDDDAETFVCLKDLDEDEMYAFITKNVRACPFYREYDEYRTVRKQN